MKKVNFKTIDSLTTPEEWLEKALSVPETQERGKTAKTPLWQWAVTAAACIVAIISVSVMLFVNPGRTTVEIKLTVPATASETALAERNSVQTDPTASQPPGTSASDCTEASASAGSAPYPAVISTVPVSQPPTGSTQPPTAPTERSSEEHPSAEPPTSESSDKPEIPTDKATENETTPATIPATMPSTMPATEPATVPSSRHTEPSTQKATEPPEIYVDTISRSFYIWENDIVYCKITDLSGKTLYGDRDLYSQQHRCTVTGRTKYQTFCDYSPKALGILPKKGCYLCEFYDMYGAVLLTEKVYLNN